MADFELKIVEPQIKCLEYGTIRLKVDAAPVRQVENPGGVVNQHIETSSGKVFAPGTLVNFRIKPGDIETAGVYFM